MTHDYTDGAALAGGVLGMGFSLAGQPLIGLVPALISLLIYLHKYWRSYRTKTLRVEIERLRAENEILLSNRINRSNENSKGD